MYIAQREGAMGRFLSPHVQSGLAFGCLGCPFCRTAVMTLQIWEIPFAQGGVVLGWITDAAVLSHNQ